MVAATKPSKPTQQVAGGTELSQAMDSVCHTSPEHKPPRNGATPEHGALMQLVGTIRLQRTANPGPLKTGREACVGVSHGSSMDGFPYC